MARAWPLARIRQHSAYAASSHSADAYAARRGERHAQLSTAPAEPGIMQAVRNTSTPMTGRAESAIWLYDRTANVTFCA
jgi:hypothetical protein